MRLTQHQLDAITEAAIDEGSSVVASLVKSLAAKAGPAGDAIGEQVSVIVEAAVSAGVEWVVEQLKPAVMDISTDGQVTATLDVG